jgi:hypothetical protein
MNQPVFRLRHSLQRIEMIIEILTAAMARKG